MFKSIVVTIALLSANSYAYDYEYWSFGEWLKSTRTPDFDKIKDVGERKSAFFKYLLPEIEKQNYKIIDLRRSIKNNSISEKKLSNLYKYYRVEEGNKNKLLSHIDIIPASLILAQGAYESNWGRSRFAKHYHNFFGLWCFKKGCGVVPLKRDKNATHEVAKFSSLSKSIEHYMRSINRNSAYDTLRKIRKHKRNNNLSITGVGLSEGLENYAEIGYEYVETVKDIIIYNKLIKYDHYTGGV